MSTIDELKAISAGLSCFGLKWPLLSYSDPGVIVGLPGGLHYSPFRRRGDGETCAAEGRSGRLGRDGYDSSVVNNIGAVLSGQHPLVEGFGNPGGCHQRHEGESGVAGAEQYRLSSGRGPGIEEGQTPLYQPVPKRSFNSKLASPMETVNLDKLQIFVDMGRLDTSNKITI
ncbi:hypothetical protein PI124_g12939 [Phytophthora idaei]|nr:hypothetical protein PI124_g12939 [Phytophthora idaei]